MKRNEKSIIFLTILFGLQGRMQAQTTIACPPNMDFEDGNYGYWKFDTGQCCPIVTMPSGQLFNRHMLTSGPGSILPVVFRLWLRVVAITP
ncbi:MAG: hypothetical protein HWD58_13090 [Bacteroidota bacterium]|nr:MAG: hypothetical protein HWD58_13090 [Bacteroidota bacterium]